MILLIDNYDSFTYNLYHQLLGLSTSVCVRLNDQITVEEIADMRPSAIVISPGPQTPAQAGIVMSVISAFHTQLPLLGVCLGHQAIGQFFGAALCRLDTPVHGKTSDIICHKDALFQDLPHVLSMMRYHSLYIRDIEKTALIELAHTHDGINMAIRHKHLPIYGFQFHPESILSPQGFDVLKNWWASVTNFSPPFPVQTNAQQIN